MAFREKDAGAQYLLPGFSAQQRPLPMSPRRETWPDRDDLPILVRHEEEGAISVGHTRNEAAKEDEAGVASSNVDKRGAMPVCSGRVV